jgi:predicted HicB family RNase H-like nuclease
MNADKNAGMSPEQERDFYADPANQVPEGRPRRRRPRMSEPVPVRFPVELLQRVRARADADDRSVSSWIRRAVEHELEHDAG